MINELDVVALTRDLPDARLKAGDIGAVVMIYDGGQAYEVEFVGLDGATIALLTLGADAVRPVRKREIGNARQVA